jgi:hypothetical protein
MRGAAGRAITPAQASSFAIQLVTRTISRNPIKVSLNFMGLFLLFFAVGFTPSPTAYERSASLMPSRAQVTAERDAHFEMERARSRFHAARGWFWSCSSSACLTHKAAFHAAEASWIVVRDAQADAVARAKQALGLFSVEGVAEARDLFWRTFAGGTAYAKRATMYDAIFVGFRSMGRDEALLSFVAEMTMRVLMNLLVGIFSGVVSFLFSVWRVIAAYRPGWPGAIAFFVLCAVSGVSFFVTVLVSMAAGVAAVAVGVASMAPALGDRPQARGGAPGARPRRDS